MVAEMIWRWLFLSEANKEDVAELRAMLVAALVGAAIARGLIWLLAAWA